jgi:hypothetical protein
MIENAKNPIRKSVPPRRDPACFELQHAIIIPKGTILRQPDGAPGTFDCPVAGGKFVVDVVPAMADPTTYKRVIA